MSEQNNTTPFVPGVVQPWREKNARQLIYWVAIVMAVLVFFTTADMRSHAPKLEGYNGVTTSVEYKHLTCDEINGMSPEQRTIMGGDFLRLAWHNIEGESKKATPSESAIFMGAIFDSCITLAKETGYLSTVWVHAAASYAYFYAPVNP